MKRLRIWWRRRKLLNAIRLIEGAGMSIVKIVNRAGTDYILDRDGALRRIGRKDK